MSKQETPAVDAPSHRYAGPLAQAIEAKWQERWEERRTYHVANPGDTDFDPAKPKKFILDMFPYPSGVGLHVGHPLGYIATDVYSRFLRMNGFNVLHPMGYDSFGLPAEQYAIQTGQHPRTTTEKNIENMQAQMRRLGLGHDPDRGLATTDVSFYKWTQWIFLQIFNSWYDRDAGRARPIEELREGFASGKRAPESPEHNPDGLAWGELSETQQRRVIDDHRLAYLAELPVNWCPLLGTVLANEEVTAEGRSERGDYPVYKRPLKQWMMRITEYCERLLEDLEPLDWPEPIKLMQRNWIGRSEGAEVDFIALESAGAGAEEFFAAREKDGWRDDRPDEELAIRVFTTRPDTLYGATYMVLAPEHPLVDRLTADAWPEGTVDAWKGQFPGCPAGASSPRDLVTQYRKFAESRSNVERQVETREKTGVFVGAFAVNPVNREKIPIFIADYVLMDYGTGAIMAVPAHDDRDFEFARQFDLPTPVVVQPPSDWTQEHTSKDGSFDAAYTGDGEAVNSAAIEGLATPEAKATITAWLEDRGLGKLSINYRLRDWLFSRQRYWGEPFPIVYGDDGLPVALEESMLPVELPEIDDYRPEVTDDPDSEPKLPLARATDWARVTIDGKEYARELNTMPNWAGSCWYYLRYLAPRDNDQMVPEKVEKYWMLTSKKGDSKPSAFDPTTCHLGGVDLYVGGAEHAVLHLLYSRFWHKVLFDLGHVSTPEPFGRLFNQGYIQAAAYRDEREVYVEASAVEEKDGKFFFEGKPVTREFGKMGKSLKNAVSPDEMCELYGADTLRLYEMYMGPLDVSKPWNTRDIVGVHRFLQRAWRNLVDEDTGALRVDDSEPDEELNKALHKTVDVVARDMNGLCFNTAIARLIEFNNKLTSRETMPRVVAESFVKMVAPLAPHFAEELWEKLGHDSTIVYEDFPSADPALLVEEQVVYPVMVNGKLRARIEVAADLDKDGVEAAAKAHEKLQPHLAGKTIKKVVLVPGRMINFVVG